MFLRAVGKGRRQILDKKAKVPLKLIQVCIVKVKLLLHLFSYHVQVITLRNQQHIGQCLYLEPAHAFVLIDNGLVSGHLIDEGLKVVKLDIDVCHIRREETPRGDPLNPSLLYAQKLGTL